MVEKTEEEEEETATVQEKQAGGGRFRIAMPFEEAVAALLEIKPEPSRRGRKKEPPPEGGDGETKGPKPRPSW